MATTPQLLTADDLLRLPSGRQRHELIAGELRTMPLHGEEHGAVASASGGALHQHVRAQRLGRVFAAGTGFQLTTDPDTVRAPDAAFVSRERAAGIGRVTGYWPGAPDLAIEVVSPNDLYTEVEEQVETWLAHGTRMAVVIDPRRRTVRVHRSLTQVRHLTEADTLDGEDVVPGWTVAVRDLFALED